ncbi:lysophospholipid acyltransferase family protein [Bauldia sp.]|uniref:lysophospholipid acyltransferase family protein n=1 Tax=Bauldia sp. TaxID=2575872 RepID=UPI003BAA5F8A
MSVLRTASVVTILLSYTLLLMPIQTLAVRRNWRLAARIPCHWQRVAKRLIGLRVTIEGTPAKPPLLITANHISWLDITVLGSVLPLSFISKAEVQTWPILGTLARLQRTVFIDRTRRSQTASAASAIARRVGGGDVMVLFPEGTTGDGNRILPFRSALIGAAGVASGMETITVQPVAVTYVGMQGIPVGRADRPSIAWYGDMDFIAHFRNLVEHGAVDAVVSFGEPITFDQTTDRKKVAEECYQAVRRMDEEAKRGASRGGNRGRLFSPKQKPAKEATHTPAPGYPGGRREEIANRAS